MKPFLLIIRTVILLTISFYSIRFTYHLYFPAKVNHDANKIRYEVMHSDTMQASVLIKEPFSSELDSVVLESIADSLFNTKPQTSDYSLKWYRVRFFYNSNWKESPYYAAKFWHVNYEYTELIPEKLEITHDTGNDLIDSIYFERHRFATSKSSLDTISYIKQNKS